MLNEQIIESRTLSAFERKLDLTNNGDLYMLHQALSFSSNLSF